MTSWYSQLAARRAQWEAERLSDEQLLDNKSSLHIERRLPPTVLGAANGYTVLKGKDVDGREVTIILRGMNAWSLGAQMCGLEPLE